MLGLGWRIAGAAACWIVGVAVPPADAGVWILKLLLMADGLLLIGLPRLAGPAARFAPLWQPRLEGSANQEPRLWRGWLVALLGVALALRLIALNTDLWMDEVFTLVRTVRPPAARLLTVFVDDNQHTLYSLLAKGSVATFGESAWALRLPAVLFGVAGVWTAARLAELVFGAREALLAAAALTVSYHDVWFSQNARAYTLLLCLATLATELLLHALRSGRWRHWLLYAVALFAAAFAHLTAVLFAVGQAAVTVALLIRDGRPWRDWQRPAVAYALAGWLTLHVYALVIPQMVAFFSQPGAGSAPQSLWTQPMWMIGAILGPLSGAEWIAAAAGLLAAAASAWWLWRRDWVFVALTVAPALTAIAVMLGLGRSLWPRSFFHLLGLAVIALAAVTIAFGDWLGQHQPKARYAPAALVLVAALVTLPAVYRYPKQDYTGARDFVLSQLEPGDTVAALHMAGRVYSLYYEPEWPEIETVEELDAAESATGRTWVIHSLPSYLATRRPDLTAILRSRYEPVRTFPGTLGDGDLFVLRSKSR
ncbi:MAG: glycosyltransferase family 39 protein [Bryobacterales bacterium]